MESIIFYNILFALTIVAISPFMVSIIKKCSNEEKIFDNNFIKYAKFDWKITLITSLIVIALLYVYGVTATFFMYSFIAILLVMMAAIDIKARIIPNSLNFVGFLVGIVTTYIITVQDGFAGVNRLLGMFTGAGIFLLIAGFAWLVYKREGMGLGDVKLMGMLGLFFGWENMIQIFILSFFVGAIISIFLLATKIKKMDDYIAFGPFIVISTIFTMFIGASTTVPYVLSIMVR